MSEIFHYLEFKKISKNWEKNVFWGVKLDFELIENSAHTANVWSINIYITYLIFFPSLQHFDCFAIDNSNQEKFPVKFPAVPGLFYKIIEK